MELIGGAVISTLVERMVAYTLDLSQMLRNYGNHHQTTADEITKCYTMFCDLNGVLPIAEANQSDNPGIARWLTDLADLVYEIEDIMEEIEYKSKLAQQQPENILGWNYFLALKRKRSKVPDKLKEITVKLEKIYKRKKMLNQFAGNPSVPKCRQIRSLDGSVSVEPIIYGRQSEKDKIVELLLERNDPREMVGIIPIVGMGGIGKTTLAQHVFKDDRVIDCFEKRVWVCISMEFEKCQIYKRIIEAITSKSCDVQDECSIEDMVRKNLSDEKFLIILDDLWNDDIYEMTQFLKPFQFGAPNSKVIITTRNTRIANQMKTICESMELKGISDDDCWSIFASHARLGLDTASSLVTIGNKLSKRCGGNPLAAAIMGGILRGNHNEESWKSVLNDASLISEKGQYKIMSVLKMSYDILPDCLKPCFLYCTMFPEDYEFHKEFLVDLWISSGLINCGGNVRKSSVEVKSLACSYFDELVVRSLLSKQKSCRTDCFVMHDLIRDTGMQISGYTYCRWNDKVKSLEKTRCLTVDGSLIAQINRRVKQDTVHSLPLRVFLTIGGVMYTDIDMDNFIWRARKLRVLSLENISKIPKCISHMIHLRYLAISSCRLLEEIPPEIGHLINLGYLNISSCSLSTISSKIGSLINLTTLHIISCQRLVTLPSEIGSLINLTTLCIISCQRLTTLPSEICSLINLTILNISGCKRLTTLPSEIGSLINLTTFNIIGCRSLTSLPSGISCLISKTTLNFSSCISLITLPREIGSLINLTTLNCSFCKSLTTLPLEIGRLINLKTLNFTHCESLTTLPSEIGRLINLTILDLTFCRSLTTLPLEIGSLINLTTLDCSFCESLTTLPFEIGGLINLTTFNITGCFNLGVEIICQVNKTSITD